jgi:hypothetical protein
MASNGSAAIQAITPVLAAYQQTIQPNLSHAQKAEALQYLEQFQKSVSLTKTEAAAYMLTATA